MALHTILEDLAFRAIPDTLPPPTILEDLGLSRNSGQSGPLRNPGGSGLTRDPGRSSPSRDPGGSGPFRDPSRPGLLAIQEYLALFFATQADLALLAIQEDPALFATPADLALLVILEDLALLATAFAVSCTTHRPSFLPRLAARVMHILLWTTPCLEVPARLTNRLASPPW